MIETLAIVVLAFFMVHGAITGVLSSTSVFATNDSLPTIYNRYHVFLAWLTGVLGASAAIALWMMWG